MKRSRKHSRLGFTMIELMIGTVIGALVLLVAVAFTQHEVRMLGLSNEVLEMTQAGRSAIDLLSEDLQNAGAGVGYDGTGEFVGLELKAFTRDAETFDANNNAIIDLTNSEGVQTTYETDDIGILLADGEYTSIWMFDTAAEKLGVCGPSAFQTLLDGGNPLIVVRTADGMFGRTVKLVDQDVGWGTPPPDDECVNGWEVWNWDTDATWKSAADADTIDIVYEAGEAHGNFRRITWYVTSDGVKGRLMRLTDETCAGRGPPYPPPARSSAFPPPGPVDPASCGEVVADDVEVLHLKVFELVDNVWTDRTGGVGLPPGVSHVNTSNRLKVDLELVIRSRLTDVQLTPHPAVELALEPPGTCVPSGCAPDHVRRMVMRASVELRNAGFMRFVRNGS